MKTITITFGERIRQLREKRGLSSMALAKQLGISRQHLWAWETGLKPVTSHRLARVAEALGVSLGEFDGCVQS